MYKDSETQNGITMYNNVKQMVLVAVRISRDDYEKLREIAEREESSVSRIIRLAIKKYLSEYYAQDKQQG
jgi:predicted transcriptional regulator